MASIDDIVLSQTEKTFQHDKDLLTLPVPDLDETLKNYLESVKPHVTEEEYRQTEFLCQQFASGIGKELHQKLCERAKGQRNWLERWWEDLAYLDFRPPLALMSMGGPGPYSEDIWPPKEGSQIFRAAITTYHTVRFWQFIRREQYKPLKDNKGRPYCMHQFRRVFNACRVPGVQRDKLLEYFKTETEGDCPSHLIVMCKGHMFMINMLDESGEVITPPEIEMQFSRAKDEAEKLGPSQDVNYLTSLPRTTWAQYHSVLMASHPQNYDVLEKIRTAVTIYGLDDEDAKDLSDLANKSILGNIQNRWCDKSMSLIAYKNGLLLCNADHSFCEGIMMVFITGYVHQKLRENNGEWQGTKAIRPQPAPVHLKFVVPDELKSKIEMAKTMYKEMQSCAICIIKKYDGYGKTYLKKVKVHPDAHCQLALHLAYYTLHGRMAPAYQTAPIKQFYHGRTETLRTCTNEASDWCKSMFDPSCSNERRYELFAKAVKKHLSKMSEACELKGCDRHLMGLAVIAKEENIPLPMLFMDPAFIKSGGGGNYILSTSSIGYSSVMGGVLPMCENCYGCFYRISDDMLTFFISTWNADKDTSSQGFGNALCKSLDTIKNMLDHVGQTNARL